MNIALVNSEYPSISRIDQGGIATYTYNLANALAQAGHTVHVFVKKGSTTFALNSNVTCVSFASKPANIIKRLINKVSKSTIAWEEDFSRGLRDALLKVHAISPLDIVDVPEYNGLAATLRPSLPFTLIINFRTPRFLIDQYNHRPLQKADKAWHHLEARAITNSRNYRTSSQALKNIVSEHYGIASGNISVIRNPIHTARFDAIKRPEQKQTFDILFVGRLERRKGAEILLETIPAILALDPRITLTCAGETQLGESTSYQDAIERNLTPDQRSRIWFLGPVKQIELPILYCRSDLYIIPSLFDNSPNCLLEAMAGRLPIIGSDVGGINEIIHHAENGLLFNPESPIEFIDCIHRLLDNPDLGRSLAQAAYTDVRQNHSFEYIATQTLDFYKKILHNMK